MHFALCSILPGLYDRLGIPLLYPDWGFWGVGRGSVALHYNAFSLCLSLPVCLSPSATVPTLFTPSWNCGDGSLKLHVSGVIELCSLVMLGRRQWQPIGPALPPAHLAPPTMIQQRAGSDRVLPLPQPSCFLQLPDSPFPPLPAPSPAQITW